MYMKSSVQVQYIPDIVETLYSLQERMKWGQVTVLQQ